MDDDGSGVAAVLVIAEVMRNIFAGRHARCGIRFVLFNAEEQGLIGSGRYARCQASTGTKIEGVFQLDMVGYNRMSPKEFKSHAGTSASCVPAGAVVEGLSLRLAKLVKRCRHSLVGRSSAISTPPRYIDHRTWHRGEATTQAFNIAVTLPVSPVRIFLRIPRPMVTLTSTWLPINS